LPYRYGERLGRLGASVNRWTENYRIRQSSSSGGPTRTRWNGRAQILDSRTTRRVRARTERTGLRLPDPYAHPRAQDALTGPEALTLADAAATVSQATGQTITHLDLDRDAWVAGGADTGAVLRMLTEIIDTGHGSRPSDDVEKATGVAPTSFADFARRAATNWDVDES
jgi:uncharacterized protein YbjT (DUF2867 family)